MAELAFLKNFATYAEAEMIKDVLEKYGIRSMVQKGNLGSPGEFSGYAGDADLYVLDENLGRAKEILKLLSQPIGE